MLTPEKRAELRELLDAATDGPWVREWDTSDKWWAIYGQPNPAKGDDRMVCPEVATLQHREEWTADTDLIVAAVNALPALLDAAAERDRLAAAIERVRELHVPCTTGVLTGDCAAEACDHEDDCPTQTFEYCAGCHEIAEAADCYYMERDARLTAYPCPTIRALSGSDGHTTRDIKQRGECPACDDHHAQREQR